MLGKYCVYFRIVLFYEIFECYTNVNVYNKIFMGENEFITKLNVSIRNENAFIS